MGYSARTKATLLMLAVCPVSTFLPKAKIVRTVDRKRIGPLSSSPSLLAGDACKQWKVGEKWPLRSSEYDEDPTEEGDEPIEKRRETLYLDKAKLFTLLDAVKEEEELSLYMAGGRIPVVWDEVGLPTIVEIPPPERLSWWRRKLKHLKFYLWVLRLLLSDYEDDKFICDKEELVRKGYQREFWDFFLLIASQCRDRSIQEEILTKAYAISVSRSRGRRIQRSTGGSMMPTIPTRCFTFGRRLSMESVGEVQVGDVVSCSVLTNSGEIMTIGKRVAALAGARVSFRNETYVVPKSHCWLIGDNVEHSTDSRVFGAVPLVNLRSVRTRAFSFFPPRWKKLT